MTAALPGRTLGDFVVGEMLGEGGMGAVYLAEQRGLGREAVIKVLRAALREEDRAQQRFLREARLASRFDHPYAAHVYAFGAEADGLLWIAMERVRGEPLSALIRAQGALAVDRFVPLFERLCEVVDSAHEQGIVHRDIKPANVMVIARAGRWLPKLLDFGVAKMGAEASETGPASDDAALTQAGALVGSPLYMAPEQFADPPRSGPKSDQYALAALAWEALTGRPPFRARSVAEIARLHATAEPDGLPATLAALEPVLRRGLAKRPEARFPSSSELGAALRAAAGLGAREEALPALPEEVRRVHAHSPQPIAEWLGALAAARSVHEAADALDGLVATLVRWLAVLALAARSRGGGQDSPRARELVAALRQRDLGELEWVELTGELTRQPDHPIPELARAFHGGRVPALLAALAASHLTESSPATLAERRRAELGRLVPLAAALLTELEFVSDYLVVAGPDATSWMGIRRAPRLRHTLTQPLAAGELVVADLEGRPVVRLGPLARLAAPSPGAPEELFLLAGHGRRGARLVADPVGFELHDETVWEWLRDLIGELGDVAVEDSEAPYRGLAAFTAADAAFFFGRERQAEALRNRLRVQRLLAVVGPSGAGKSSLVQAGLLPLLSGWQVEVVRPGPSPLATVDAALARLDGEALLVVDQLEELFTLSSDHDEREAVARRLVDASARVRVVVTLRDDFLARAGQLAPLRDLLAPALELVTTPAAGDLVRILVEPAARAGYRFEDPELPARMVAEVAEQPGALALLSFTAARLWERRDRHFRQLPTRAYAALGGVGGALAQHAEEALAHMTADEQRRTREAFRHLVTAEGTRAVLSRGELAELLGGEAASAPVVEKLVAARLLVAGEDGRVEIIHEALLAAWPRLVAWRNEDAEGARLRDQLRAAARQWDERSRPRGLLWRDDALAELRVWRARHQAALTGREAAFVAASLAAAARSRRTALAIAGTVFVALAAAAGISFQLFRQARASAAEAAARLTDSFVEQGRQQFLAGAPMRAQVLLAEAWRRGARDPGVTYLLGRVGVELDNQLAVGDHQGLVFAVAIAPDGRGWASSSFDGTVALWDWDGKLRHRLRHADQALRVAYRDDGLELVTTSSDRSARLWDVASGRELRRLAHGDRVYDAVFRPGEAQLATASLDGAVRLWDLASGNEKARWQPGGQPEHLRFTRDGKRLVSVARAGEIAVIDLDENRVRQIAAHGGRATSVVLDRAGARLFVAGGSAEATLWEVDTSRELARFRQGQIITSGDLADDGARAVTAAADGTVTLWAVETQTPERLIAAPTGVALVRFLGERGVIVAGGDGRALLYSRAGTPTAIFEGHRAQVRAVAIASGQDRLITGGDDHTARVWDLRERKVAWRRQLGAELYHAEPITGGAVIAVGADGRALQLDGRGEIGAERTLVEAEQVRLAGTELVIPYFRPPAVEVWDLGLTHRRLRVEGHTEGVADAMLSPDGTILASASRDRTVRLWDGRSGAALATLRGHSAEVISLAFRPDGRVLASAGNDNVVRTWDVAGRRALAVLSGHTSYVQQVVFAPDGTTLVSASSDGTVRVWDAARSVQLRSMPHPGRVTDVAVDASGTLIATACADGIVRVWELARGRLLEELPHGADVATIAWQGDRVLSAGVDGVVVAWDLTRASGTDASARNNYVLRDGLLVER